jgi:hypothetical protein
VKLIFKLLKSLFNILILTAIIIAVFTGSSLSQEKRIAFFQKLENATPFSITKYRQKLRFSLNQQLQNSDSVLVQEALGVFSGVLTDSNEHFQIVDLDCAIHQSNPLQEKKSRKIFQWEDKQGRIHFGDASESQNAQDVSEQYEIRNQFISLSIIPINASLPIDIKNKIQVSTMKMFLILSDALRINQLHQLELSLKLFGRTDEFKLYLSEKAPQLKQAVGFYISKDNEASVLIQQNSEQTLGLIRHESSHVMMANLYGQSPIWLNEGFAEYFQGLSVRGLETTVYPSNYWLKLLRKAHQRDSLSLGNHLKLSVQEWQGQSINRHYAEAWSIVYFLLSSPEHKEILSQYFSALNDDRCLIPNASIFFDDHYPGGLNQMDKDWKAWLTQYQIHPHRY